MDDDRDFLSWPEAAEIAECPVSTIDWYTRTGRIKHRPKLGARPSLRRDSVEEFAAWWRTREAERQARRAEREHVQQAKERHRARAVELGIRPGRIPALTPGDSGWLTTAEAAAVLGVSAETTTRLARQGAVRAERVGSRWWLDDVATRTLAEQRRSWMSFAEVAALVGCSRGALETAIANGLITQSRTPDPALSRAIERRGLRPCLASAPDRTSRTGTTRFGATRRRARVGRHRDHRPDPGHQPSRVRQLASRNRLPHVRRRKRLWFRRDLLEMAAAARAQALRHGVSGQLSPSDRSQGRAPRS